MMPLLYVLGAIVLVVLSLYLLKKRSNPTNGQSDEQSDNPTNYGIFYAKERWMLEQAELLKKEREEEQGKDS